MLAFDIACLAMLLACHSPCKHPAMGANRREWEQIGGNGSKHAGKGANRWEREQTFRNGSK